MNDGSNGVDISLLATLQSRSCLELADFSFFGGKKISGRICVNRESWRIFLDFNLFIKFMLQ